MSRLPSSQAKATRTPKGGTSAGSAYDVISLVNQLRLSNGLAAFQTNSALMASAQSHSQYQANIGSTTHTGSGGSDVKTRALAAGYGGGANVSVIENIYGGMGATPQRAVSWWQGDGPHLNTMLSTRHTDAGAGIAVSNGVVYITLDVGSVQGGSAPPISQSTPGVASNPASTSAAAGPPAVAFNPVLIASAKPGWIDRPSGAGWADFWTIAATYKVPLPDLLKLNGFTDSTFIYPGDKILIKPAGLPSPTLSSENSSASPAPTTGASAHKPASGASQSPTEESAGGASTAAFTLNPPKSSNPSAAAQNSAQRVPVSNSPALLLVVIAVLLIGGAGLVLTGNVLRRLE